MSSASQRRILRDFKKIHAENSKEYVVQFDPKMINHWNATLFGPEETVWDGACFSMTIDFPEDYPHTHPDVKFVDIPFHPNVYQNGKNK